MSPSLVADESTKVVGAGSEDKSLKKTAANGPSSMRHEEYQYLDLIQEILEHGEFRPDRYARVLSYPSLMHGCSSSAGLAPELARFLPLTNYASLCPGIHKTLLSHLCPYCHS